MDILAAYVQQLPSLCVNINTRTFSLKMRKMRFSAFRNVDCILFMLISLNLMGRFFLLLSSEEDAFSVTLRSQPNLTLRKCCTLYTCIEQTKLYIYIEHFVIAKKEYHPTEMKKSLLLSLSSSSALFIAIHCTFTVMIYPIFHGFIGQLKWRNTNKKLASTG